MTTDRLLLFILYFSMHVYLPECKTTTPPTNRD